MAKTNRTYPPAELRFWQKVDKSPGHGPKGDCWPWTARWMTNGYGKLRLGPGRAVSAHRFSWELHNGPIPDDLWVLHDCDNPPCVNPDHLFLGTHADNMHDMMQKGRHRSPGSPGESQPMSKLTDQKVLSIRARWPGTKQKDLAVEFGVSKSLISAVVLRQRWLHI